MKGPSASALSLSALVMAGLILCLLGTEGWATGSPPQRSARRDGDSLRRDSTRRDSLVSADRTKDSAKWSGADTVLTWSTKNATDTVVTYASRDSITYRMREKEMRMFGAARIDYGRVKIDAERITIRWNESTIHAAGIADTSGTDSTKRVGTPVFHEGADTYTGEEMTYNFKTERGIITGGETSIDNGFYRGDRIKRMGEAAYFISDGQYTTCDNPDHKHYYFRASRMKIIPNDLIIAEPIVLYIEDIPLLAAPFVAIPSKSGRQSGILIPTFGELPSRGRFLKGGGYYWAASDYWDLALTGDWYSKGGYQVQAEANYAVRYVLTGNLTAAYGRQTFNIGNPFVPDDDPQQDYRFTLTHNHTLDPVSRLTANLNFQSTSYTSNHSNNINELLNQRIYSQASFSTSWASNRSLSANATRDQDLRQGTSVTVAPDVTFTQSQIFPFRGESSNELSWYELIGFNYTGQFRNQMETKFVTLNTERSKEDFDRQGLRHSVNLLASPKLGYVTISPSFSYEEKWYGHRLEREWDEKDSLVRYREARGFFMTRSFTMGVSASTKLYGTIAPNVAGILGLRHTMMPSISYRFNPDFTAPGWGNRLRYSDGAGTQVVYDPYGGFGEVPGEVFGGSGGPRSQSLGFGINNIIEMKLRPAAGDTSETPRKMQLLGFDVSTSYDFEKDSMKLAPVNLSFRTNIRDLLDISGSARFSPYVFDRDRMVVDYQGKSVRSPGEVNRWLLSEGHGLARMTDFGINLSTSLSSDLFRAAGNHDSSASEYSHVIPWNLGLYYSYSINQSDPDNVYRQSNLSVNLSFSPTPKWKVSARAFYDFIREELSAPEIDITRDLHCWEMAFTWVPIGEYRRFYFVIRLRAPQLKDLKLERQGSDREIP